jgi:hypothetical protein
MVLIVKPASSAILTDHVFNTTNQNTMISLRKLPQIFLKQELHETLHTKMWSAPSMQVPSSLSLSPSFSVYVLSMDMVELYDCLLRLFTWLF